MKNITQFKKGLLASVALGLFATGTAAAQTTADTLVSNTFTLDYQVNDADQPQITNSATPTTFRVDRLVDLSVTATGTDVSVAPGQTNAQTVFTLANDGNGQQAYNLDVNSELTGADAFDPTDPTGTGAAPVIEYFVDADSDGIADNPAAGVVFDPLNDATFPILNPDEQIVIIVSQNIPAGTADAETGDIALVANTLNSPDPIAGSGPAFAETVDDSTVDLAGVGNDIDVSENVLNDDASGTGEDAANDGQDAAIATYIIAEADVTGVKEVQIVAETVADDAACQAASLPTTNDQYSIPGACVEYRIRVTNNDTRDATGINVTDNLPSELTFVSASQTGFTSSTTTGAPALNLAQPATGADCAAPAGCPVVLTNAVLLAPTGGSATQGVVTIRARLK